MRTEPELLNERLERLAMVLDEIMPNCALLVRDALELLKEQDEEHRRLLSWLGKFCRHIDNGDAWLTDEENLAFFKEKMKQQFGWNTD